MEFPCGTRLTPFIPDRQAQPARALLNASFAQGAGEIQPFDSWWPALTSDSEYAADLCLVVEDEGGGEILAFAQCWTSGFVKDFAVAAAHRRIGLGRALMGEIFVRFTERGAHHLDLKIMPDNHIALQFYQSLGFAPVDQDEI